MGQVSERSAREIRNLVDRERARLLVMSIPVAKLDANGKQVSERLPITMGQAARNPAVWVALLRDTMLRSRNRGMRIPPSRWMPGDARRADKAVTTKLSRRLLLRVQTG